MPKHPTPDYSDKFEYENYDYRQGLGNDGYVAVTEICHTLQEVFDLMRLHIVHGTPGFIDTGKAAAASYLFRGYLGKPPGRSDKSFHDVCKVVLRW